jgi:hypothetical protein
MKNTQMVQEQLQRSLKFAGVLEEGMILNESDLTALNEGISDFFLKNKLSKLQMKFMERGANSIFFIKHESGVEWIEFMGSRVIDSGKFRNLSDAELFIGEKASDGYKLVDKEGTIKSIFKKIIRGIAHVVKFFGATSIVVGAVIVMAAFFFPVLMGQIGVAMAIGGVGAGILINGFVSYGAGWVGLKIAEPQRQMPNINNNGSETVVNEDFGALAIGAWAGGVIFGSVILGSRLGIVLRDMKARKNAKEAYNRFNHLVDGKFIKESFNKMGVSDEDILILLLASNIQVDSSSYDTGDSDFDTDRKHIMVKSRAKSIFDSVASKKVPELFKEGDKTAAKFGDAEQANLVAFGAMAEVLTNVQSFVNSQSNVGVTFDNNDQNLFKSMLRNVKQRYRM